jgi:ketosteroid isomerase-like protein
MKKTISACAMLCLILSGTTNSIGQTKKQKSEAMETVTKKQSKEVVQNFFAAFGSGDFNGVINSFHDSCTLVAIRDGQRDGNQIYGTYKGKEGAKTFLTNLGNAFDTKAFAVEHIIGEGNVSFANGKFTQVIKSTQKSFPSDWALMCVIKDDKIFEYHFYEDSQKFSESNQ